MASRVASITWPVVRAERRALIEDLDNLTAEQWATPSLCPGWDVHDVLAHLVDTARTTKIGFMRTMIAAGFDFDKDNALGIERERRADPADTLLEFREVAWRSSGPPAPLATRLVEAFVHGEDIRRPLGLRRDYPGVAVLEALKNQVATSVKMGGGREFVKGLRLVATDVGYQFGKGPELRGSALALLMAVSGRPVPSGDLSGPGRQHFLGRVRS